MNKRLPESQRLKLEARLQALREVSAYLEPGKVSGIVDKVGPEQTDIKGVIVSIMKLMEADPETSTYHTASIKTLLKSAMEMADAGENPEQEAQDFQDPAMHMAEDLEHEVQTMDDHRLIQEVQQLEQHMKEDLAKLPGAAPVAPAAPSPFPPKSEEPKAEAPSPFPPKDSASKSETPEKKESPKSEEAPEEAPEEKDDEKDDKPEMKAEARLALLMSLPKSERIAKAAKLKALAGVLEADEVPVSPDNEMGDGNSELSDHYEPQGEGSMKDVKAAALKNTARQLLAALEDEEAKDEKEDAGEESTDKEAVLSLALRHLIASVEDMEEAKDEDKSEEEDKEPSMEERKAILKARLANMKRTATVDGKSMKTPKEVPSPDGTTEDNLKGDAKIQYSTTSGEEGLDVINDRRTPNKKDKSVAGTDEPNALYSSNNPAKDRYEPTTESDSSKDVNNKRVLKDMGEAVYNPSPTSPTDHMEMGSGSHQKEKTWEKAKSESDTTPSGERLVGLAQMQKMVDRAVTLAGQMSEQGLIKTEAQLKDKIIELAIMSDEVFEKVASFLSTNATPETPRRKVAGELPPWLNKDKDEDDSEEVDEKDDHDEEESDKKEAGLVRRASQSNTTRKTERGGLKTPLLSGQESMINHRASTISRNGGNSISEKLSGLAWSDPKVEARKKADLDEYFDVR